MKAFPSEICIDHCIDHEHAPERPKGRTMTTWRRLLKGKIEKLGPSEEKLGPSEEKLGPSEEKPSH